MFFNHSWQFHSLTHQSFLFSLKVYFFLILSIIALIFPKCNVQRNFFQNIFQRIGNVLHIFTLIFFVLVIWQFNAFCITVFLQCLLQWFWNLLLYFSSTVFEYVDKTFYIIGIFRHFFIFFILLGIFFFLVFCLCSCDFVSPFYMFFTSLLVLTVIIYQQVLVFFIHANIDKDGNHL